MPKDSETGRPAPNAPASWIHLKTVNRILVACVYPTAAAYAALHSNIVPPTVIATAFVAIVGASFWYVRRASVSFSDPEVATPWPRTLWEALFDRTAVSPQKDVTPASRVALAYASLDSAEAAEIESGIGDRAEVVSFIFSLDRKGDDGWVSPRPDDVRGMLQSIRATAHTYQGLILVNDDWLAYEPCAEEVRTGDFWPSEIPAFVVHTSDERKPSGVWSALRRSDIGDIGKSLFSTLLSRAIERAGLWRRQASFRSIWLSASIVASVVLAAAVAIDVAYSGGNPRWATSLLYAFVDGRMVDVAQVSQRKSEDIDGLLPTFASQAELEIACIAIERRACIAFRSDARPEGAYCRCELLAPVEGVVGRKGWYQVHPGVGSVPAYVLPNSYDSLAGCAGLVEKVHVVRHDGSVSLAHAVASDGKESPTGTDRRCWKAGRFPERNRTICGPVGHFQGAGATAIACISVWLGRPIRDDVTLMRLERDSIAALSKAAPYFIGVSTEHQVPIAVRLSAILAGEALGNGR